jgi:TrpR-related protein YerC/YecD
MDTMKKDPSASFPTYTPADFPSDHIRELMHAVTKLQNEKEAANFFRDLLTMAEIKEFANRWQMVKLLYQGVSYAKIAKQLKVSTTTVTRVAHWIHHGMGGYKAVADRLFGPLQK